MTGDALSCERCGAHPVSAAEFLYCDRCFARVRQQAAARLRTATPDWDWKRAIAELAGEITQ